MDTLKRQLNCSDERIWKSIIDKSSELISKLGLNLSPQEPQISQTAEVLCKAFGFPLSQRYIFVSIIRLNLSQLSQNNSTSNSDLAARGVLATTNYGLSSVHGVENFAGGCDGSISSRATGSTSSSIYAASSDTSPISKQAQDLLFSSSSNSVVENAQSGGRVLLLKYFENTKNCAGSPSLMFLGKSVIDASIGCVIVKSFVHSQDALCVYFQGKFTSQVYLANFYRDLFAMWSENSLNDEDLVKQLYTSLGKCVKQIGFIEVLNPLCQLFYLEVLKENSWISPISMPFQI